VSFPTLLTLLRSRSACLLAGQLDPVVASFVYPLPIFAASRWIVLGNADQALSFCRHAHAVLCQRGVVALQPKVTAVELPRGGRFRVWVDWYELALPATGTRLTSAIYYMRDGSAGPQVEMIAYQLSRQSDICPQTEELALSA